VNTEKRNLVAYSVREGKDGKKYWNRIGAAFPHKEDEGFNINLDALPLDGKVVVMPPKEAEEDVAA
jgi:hypothetical protein